MKSLLPPAAYIDPGWFQRERELMLKPLWQFIGLKVMLEKPNAFIARDVFGIPVVVQNFDGELRAYENLCLHRSNPLQSEPHGVRPLVCSYHGWHYDVNGVADRIPFDAEIYRYPADERESLKLRPIGLECIGNLVFVNVSDNPMPIGEQFPPEQIVRLRHMSSAFDDEVLMAVFPARMNWKLAYENLRDGNHPRFVHAKTLYQLVKFGPAMDEAGIAYSKEHHAAGDHSREEGLARLRRFTFGGKDSPMEVMPDYTWHAHVKRYGSADYYYNWLVFPNLHMASGSGGYSFIIEHHVPVAADRTDLHVYYVTAKKKQPYAASAAVLLGHLLGAERVLREDIAIMEKVQSGLHAGARHAHMGDYEYFNMEIERWMHDVMEGHFEL